MISSIQSRKVYISKIHWKSLIEPSGMLNIQVNSHNKQ